MSKKFASQTAVDGVNLEIRPGEFFSLLGPSGCGKTTLLRIIAGFETPTSGELFWEQTRFDRLSPQDRPFNMVFQKYALFPHLSVAENIAFGLKVKKVEESMRQKRVMEALELVGLADFKTRRPETLSGGQAQRVALARALVNEPKILLLDEPLSALDQKMREHMQSELREIQRRLGITFILVTHDQEEALALSDRIAVMNAGRLEQVASPRELYDKPASHFVGRFVGSMGSLCGNLMENKDSGECVIKAECGRVIKGRGQVGAGSRAEAFVRPEKVKLGAQPGANEVSANILNVSFKGLHYELQLGVDTASGEIQRLRAFVPASDMTKHLSVGQATAVHFLPQDTFIFEKPI